MRIIHRLLTIALVSFGVAGNGFAQTITVDVPDGIKKLKNSQYLIGDDLKVMLQLYPRHQYDNAGFYENIVKGEYEEKQKELLNIKHPVETQALFKELLDELKGSGFILIGVSEKGQKIAIGGYYLEKNDRIIKVTIMGNGVTYEKNSVTITELLKAIRVE